MKIRYFLQPNTDPVEINGTKYSFAPAHRNISTGGVWGILAMEDGGAAQLLAKEGPKYGVSEISQEDAAIINQKKSQPNINLVVRQNTSSDSQSVGRVEEAEKPEAVEDVDDLLSGPSAPAEEPAASPTPSPVEVTSEPEEEESSEAPKKKGGRPRKNQG